MVSVFFLSPNRPSYVFGAGLLTIGLAGIVFAIIYIVSGMGWVGSSGGKAAWIIAGVVMLLLSLGVSALGGALLFYNSLIRRKENRGDKDVKPAPISYFDLERIEGALAVPILSLSTLMLINGIVFYITSKVLYDPQNFPLKRAAREFKTGATWMFVIMFGLWIAAGICLFVNRYYVMNREGGGAKKNVVKETPKKDKKTGKKKNLPPPPPLED